MPEIGIYKITSPTGKVYIGQSKNIFQRKKHYANLKCKKQPRIYASLLKYGFNSHIFEIICLCNENELNLLERKYQEYYDSIGGNGLNCKLVDTAEKKAVYNEYLIKKIRAKLVGRKMSDEAKIKMSVARLREWKDGVRVSKSISWDDAKRKEFGEKMKAICFWKGKSHSDLSKLKMSKSATGRVMSKDCILKRTISQTGLKRSEQTKKNISKSLIGKKFSEERKKKLSESSWMSRPVINEQNGVYYNSVKEAAIYYDISGDSLRRRLCGKVKNNTYLIYA